MRNKAPLALIEQTVMLLVFALAATACLKVFVWADVNSQYNAKRDQALIQVQSVAETLKSCGGDFIEAADIYGGTWNNSEWLIHYDANWQQTDQASAFLLRVTPQSNDSDFLGTAILEVLEDEICLVDLNVAWQEVEGDV